MEGEIDQVRNKKAYRMAEEILGKIKEKFLKDGIDEFLKRLTPYASVEIIELPAIEIKDENLTQKVLKEEGEKILSHIKPQSYVITMEIKGKMLSSEELAEKIAKSVVKSRKPISLEPMTPYERKVIHSKLQNHSKVKTASVGEGIHRKVIISLK